MYILMHQNKPVFDFQLDELTSTVSFIGEIHSKEHIPVGIHMENEKVDRSAFNGWWRANSIPVNRAGIKEALLKLHVERTEKLLEKSYRLSLSDSYWMLPKHKSLTWNDLNFFENDFSEDVGNILFGNKINTEQIDYLS